MFAWFSSENRKMRMEKRMARRRIDTYFREVALAITEARGNLTLIDVRSYRSAETGFDSLTGRIDTEADFLVAFRENQMSGHVHYSRSELSDRYYDEGTFVMFEGVRLGMEYRGVSTLLDLVAERARQELKARWDQVSHAQEQAEARMAEILKDL